MWKLGALDLQGITIDFMTRGRKIEDPAVPIDYVFPEDGAVLVPSPIAIVKDSQNVEAAKSFIDFVLSREGQELMSAQGVAPVRLDVTPPSGIPTITQMSDNYPDRGVTCCQVWMKSQKNPFLTLTNISPKHNYSSK